MCWEERCVWGEGSYVWGIGKVCANAGKHTFCFGMILKQYDH